MNMEAFMDQQIALLTKEHEDTIRALKEQHSKELEAEVDRHREELEAALARAVDVAPTSYATSAATSSSSGDKDVSTKERDTLSKEKEAWLREKDTLVKERESLQYKLRVITRELEESARSMLGFNEQLSDKDEKIAKLRDETKSLYLSLNDVNIENQSLKEKAKLLKRRINDESLSPSSSPVTSSSRSNLKPQISFLPPSKPLFANPLLDKYWPLIYLVVFGVVLSLRVCLF